MGRVFIIAALFFASLASAETHVIPQSAQRDFVQLLTYVRHFKPGDEVVVGTLKYVVGEKLGSGFFGTAFELVSINGQKPAQPEVIKFSASEKTLSLANCPSERPARELENQVEALQYLKDRGYNVVNVNHQQSQTGVLVMSKAEGVTAQNLMRMHVASNDEYAQAMMKLGRIAKEFSGLMRIPSDTNTGNIQYNPKTKEWIIYDPGTLATKAELLLSRPDGLDGLNADLKQYIQIEGAFWAELGRSATEPEIKELLRFTDFKAKPLIECQNDLLLKLLQYRPELLAKMIRANSQIKAPPEILGERWVNLYRGQPTSFEEPYWTLERMEIALRLNKLNEYYPNTLHALLDKAATLSKSKSQFLDLLKCIPNSNRENAIQWLSESKQKQMFSQWNFDDFDWRSLEMAWSKKPAELSNQVKLNWEKSTTVPLPYQEEPGAKQGSGGIIKCIRDILGRSPRE